MTDNSSLFMQADDQVEVRVFDFEKTKLYFLAEDIEDEDDEDISERWGDTCGKLLHPSTTQQMSYGAFMDLTGTVDL